MPALTGRAIADLERLESAAALLDEQALDARLDAIEQLTFIDQVLRANGPGLEAHAARAIALRGRLETINHDWYVRLRHRLRTGAVTRENMRALLVRHSHHGQSPSSPLHLGSEAADALVDGVLELDRFTGAPTVEHPDLVHLEDTPVRVLLELVDHVHLQAGDCLCDLGSGLGRAAILLHWLSGLPVRGIEIQPAYCTFSRRLAEEFGLARVTFQQADARDADLGACTVFYMFTPFKGRMLRAVLDRLREEAQRRPITVCTYGSVSLAVAQERWLGASPGSPPHEFALCVWRS